MGLMCCAGWPQADHSGLGHLVCTSWHGPRGSPPVGGQKLRAQPRLPTYALERRGRAVPRPGETPPGAPHGAGAGILRHQEWASAARNRQKSKGGVPTDHLSEAKGHREWEGGWWAPPASTKGQTGWVPQSDFGSFLLSSGLKQNGTRRGVSRQGRVREQVLSPPRTFLFRDGPGDSQHRLRQPGAPWSGSRTHGGSAPLQLRGGRSIHSAKFSCFLAFGLLDLKRPSAAPCRPVGGRLSTGQ